MNSKKSINVYKYKIACINGPNLNLLGIRKQNFYGQKTLKNIQKELIKKAKKKNANIIFFQSNCEGTIIDFIQKKRDRLDGIIINAGPLSFYGYALRDALENTQLPVISIHLSNIHRRNEEFRHKDIMADIAMGGIFGFKEESYYLGIQAIVEYLKKKSAKK